MDAVILLVGSLLDCPCQELSDYQDVVWPIVGVAVTQRTVDF